jgi:assimilatory nitrate reductase catalytic subunit
MDGFATLPQAERLAASAVRTTCPYCGVGCGVVVTTASDGNVAIAGDRDHPANFGRLCSKGAALAEVLTLDERLLHPEINGTRASWDEALDAVAAGFRATIAEHGPDAVALYVSGQCLTEDYYVANKLMKGFIGSGNIDTNSRLCMASSVAGQKRAFGSDTVPGCYEDLEDADLVVLVGSNLAWCHPVLYQRLVAAKAARPGLRVVVIDPRRTATCDIADLHLQLRPGSDVALFNGLLAHLAACGATHQSFVAHHTEGSDEALAAAGELLLGALAEECGIGVADLATFLDLFAATERVVTLYSQGVNQSSVGTDKVNAIINCHLLTGRIGRRGMGPFSITGQPNAMGGREVGGLANQLAAHLEFDRPGDADRLARFWSAPRLARRPGLKAVDLFRAVERGEIRALWIIGTNPAASMPDADRVRRALAACPFVVVSDCVSTSDTAAAAHILLPAAAWSEKDGTVTNSERRISRQRAFRAPPGEARADWWALAEVARRLGFGDAFAWRSAAAVFREHALLSAFENGGARDFDIGALADLSDAAYDALEPVQWPLPAGATQGTQRLFADGRFFTPSRRARFIPVRPYPPVEPADGAFPLLLNTGRMRDQWHTMTRTGLSPRLAAHRPEPTLEIHPADASRHELADGALAQVESRRGELLARVVVTDAQRPGEVFAPMHWSRRYAPRGGVGPLTSAAVDPISGQPELKLAAVRVAPWPAAWSGIAITSDRSRSELPEYAVAVAERGAWRHILAGTAIPSSWPEWSRHLFGGSGAWSELHDTRTRIFRAVRIAGGRLETALFIGPTAPAIDTDWIVSLFGRALSPEEQVAVLAGRRARQDAAPAGRTLCACFAVGRDSVRRAIVEEGLASPEAIAARLKAGSNCGSCLPEIRALIAEARDVQRRAA